MRIEGGGNQFQNYNFNKKILNIDTKDRFLIYKVANRVFQIGEINYDLNYINKIIGILDRGFKFIPCFHFNNFHVFKSLILSIEKEMFNFNRQMFFKKISLENEKKQSNQDSIIVDLNISDCSSLEPCDSVECIFSKFDKKRRNFSKNKPFKVIQLDKNVGAGIISNDLYLELANEVFDDLNTYEKLEQDPLDNAKEEIYDILIGLYEKNFISKKLFELLKPNFGSLGVASIIAKIHKPVFSMRQIISYKNHITAPCSVLIDGILTPFVRNCQSFILDSQNLIQKSEGIKVKKNSILVTADVVNLYSSIDHKECLKRVTEFIKKDFSSKHLNIKGFRQILKILLKYNLFKFNGNYYKQKLGIAMGSKCGPSVANIFVHTYELKWIEIFKPSLYVRFIDDIFMIIEQLDILENFINAFGSLKLTFNHGEEVEYLDLLIKIDRISSKLNFSVFFKKTNTFSYLLASSNHPKFIFKNIPKSLFIRLRRICSLFSDFIKFSSILSTQLIERGYDAVRINKIFHTVAFLDREKLLKYRVKPERKFSKCIFFKTVFDKNISLVDTLSKNVFKKTIKNKEELKELNLFVVNKMQPNLKSLMVHDFKIPSIYKNFFKKCNNANCKTCLFAEESYFIQLTNKFILPIFDNSNCSTENCIYFLKCNLCNGFYVGQTKNFKKRFSSHKSNIKNFVPFKDPFCCVANHFNLKLHSTTKHLTFFIIKKNITWLEYRLSLESFFINLCKKLGVNLINDYIPPIKTLIKR